MQEFRHSFEATELKAEPADGRDSAVDDMVLRGLHRRQSSAEHRVLEELVHAAPAENKAHAAEVLGLQGEAIRDVGGVPLIVLAVLKERDEEPAARQLTSARRKN